LAVTVSVGVVEVLGGDARRLRQRNAVVAVGVRHREQLSAPGRTGSSLGAGDEPVAVGVQAGEDLLDLLDELGPAMRPVAPPC
jgi:hypothetical protein